MAGSRKRSTSNKKILWLFLAVLGVLVAAALVFTLIIKKRAGRHEPVSGEVEGLSYPVSYAEQEDGTLLVTLKAEEEEGFYWNGAATGGKCFSVEEKEGLSWLLTPTGAGDDSLRMKRVSSSNPSLIYEIIYISFTVDDNLYFTYSDSRSGRTVTDSLDLDGKVQLQSSLQSDGTQLDLWLLESKAWQLENQPETVSAGTCRPDGENSYFSLTARASGEEQLIFINEELQLKVYVRLSVQADAGGKLSIAVGDIYEKDIAEASADIWSWEPEELAALSEAQRDEVVKLMMQALQEEQPELSEEDARAYAQAWLAQAQTAVGED